MPPDSPGLRPLTISERATSTLYGMVPTGFMLLALRIVFTVLSGPGDLSVWEFVRYVISFDADVNIPIIDKYFLPTVMAQGMYAVFYFTFSRSLGHMVVNAYVVNARTGRRMRTWQKVVRSALQLVNGYSDFFRILDLLSIASVLIDRERRRSIYDLLSGTVVVVGWAEPDEPETARAPAQSRAGAQESG